MKKRRLTAFLCTAALFLGLAAPAGAAAGRYSDLPKTHWAYEYLDKAAAWKILLGMGDGRMAPDDTLTWAQCLTIAARTFAPEAYAAAVARGEAWDVTAYRACDKAGFLLPEWEGGAIDLGAPISRQDTVALLDRAIPEEVTGKRTEYNYETWERITLTAETTLADFAGLPGTYRKAVSRLFDLEIVKGSPVEEAGTTRYYFNGADTLRRADGATMFIRALEKLDRSRYGEKKKVTVHVVDNEGTPLMDDMVLETTVGRYLSHEVSQAAGKLEAMRYYTRYSEDLYYDDVREVPVSTACDEYTYVYYPMNEMERARQDFFDAVLRGEMTYDDYWWQSFNRYELGENEYKHYLLFGDRGVRRYSSQAEAKEHQVSVTIPMWKLNKNGQKVSSSGSFLINAAIADDVVNIFTEIYNDPEQFPLKEVGGYGWRGDSATGEHNCGTAIDINWTDNYQIRDGKVLAGTCWQPGENPYSITPEGSVVRIFAKYGWSWGGDAWAAGSDASSGYHDYMHFSYMGG